MSLFVAVLAARVYGTRVLFCALLSPTAVQIAASRSHRNSDLAHDGATFKKI